jgi:hypothetical protein
MSDLLAQGQTPEAWSQKLRLIRTKARKSGHFHQLGRLMLLTPAQMEQLLEPGHQDMVSHTDNWSEDETGAHNR